MKDAGALSNVVFVDGYTPVALVEDDTNTPDVDESAYSFALNTTVVPTVDVTDFDWVESNLSFELKRGSPETIST